MKYCSFGTAIIIIGCLASNEFIPSNSFDEHAAKSE